MLTPQHARIRSFDVVPVLPAPLQPLETIAHNLWWTWQPEAVELFSRIDRNLWRSTGHNPIKLLGRCPQSKLDAFAKDEAFLASLDRAHDRYQRHMKRTPWHEAIHGEQDPNTFAYFCAEFGMTESYQIYSGGLGILAGDHLKSASELGLPLIAVGLLYKNGYFHQYLNADGWQQERYPEMDLPNLPVEPVFDDKGDQIKVHVHMPQLGDLPGRSVAVGLWITHVGRIRLYLLDTNLPENAPADREITRNLYGGNQETRIQQEVVLGIGGVHALDAIGIRPKVCHMNEGHSAFLALERIRRLIAEYGVNFDEAREFAKSSHIFTTHTPVPAGIDRFDAGLVKHYFSHYVDGLKLDMEGLLALGRENVLDKDAKFSMAVLALRTSDFANGVSELHGHVSRDMFQDLWPGVPTEEVPITHVTNGVHARTWLSGDLSALLTRYLGSRWQSDPVDHEIWSGVHDAPDDELWRVKQDRRYHLIAWVRRKLRAQMESQGHSEQNIKEMVDALNADTLTIGFARRFATYKRGDLLLRDTDRLLKLLGSAEKPVQFLIAGKAHPADNGGKEIIQKLVQFARESEIGHRLVFLEDYDMDIGRRLTQGCDVWLNNPRRGMEASGTSGMKAAINGVLNLSILDGWWDEAYVGGVGWAIGRREDYDNEGIADERESDALYDLLEAEVVPTFYDRDGQGIPRKWVAMMKRCIAALAPAFNTNRMVQDYAEQLYFPALKRQTEMGQDDIQLAKDTATQVDRLRYCWSQLHFDKVEIEAPQPMGITDPMQIEAVVKLGELQPQELRIQLYAGPLNNDGHIVHGIATDMDHAQDLGDGTHRYTGHLKAQQSGRYGFGVRAIPGGRGFDGIQVPGLIYWDTKPIVPKKRSPRKKSKVATEA